MKTITLGFTIILTLFFSTPLFSQFIAVQNGDKIGVRSISGAYLTSGYYSGLKDIAPRKQYHSIVVWFNQS